MRMTGPMRAFVLGNLLSKRIARAAVDGEDELEAQVMKLSLSMRELYAYALALEMELRGQLAELEAEVAAGYEEAAQTVEHRQLKFLRDRLEAELTRGETVGAWEGMVPAIVELEEALVQAGQMHRPSISEEILSPRRFNESRK